MPVTTPHPTFHAAYVHAYGTPTTNDDVRAYRRARADASRKDHHMSTTTNAADTVTVKANQWAAYVAKRDGGTTTDAMNAGGYASTGAASAAITRVKDAVDAGKTVVVDGKPVDVGTGGTTGGTPTIDREGIADGIMDGAGDFIAMMEKHVDAANVARERASKLRADADAADADADAATHRADRVKVLASDAGFDWDAFDKAVKDASGDTGTGDTGDTGTTNTDAS